MHRWIRMLYLFIYEVHTTREDETQNTVARGVQFHRILYFVDLSVMELDRI